MLSVTNRTLAKNSRRLSVVGPTLPALQTAFSEGKATRVPPHGVNASLQLQAVPHVILLQPVYGEGTGLSSLPSIHVV
jgi:hypothetical protein